ncbi:MAG: class I SAM-dependent methyltransferase, partial [Candidatus Methylomirabilales bacterium]
GGGAASLPLASWATWIAAVDSDEAMLGDLARRAERLGLSVEAILGTWPEVADHSPVADVVVCHHVFYNVSDLEPFVRALTAHARRRVVVEITDRHPLTALNPLWMRFHGLLRPERPTAEDAAAALQALGFDQGVERWEPPPEPPHHSFAEVVALARRRLCLPAEADAEVAQALQEMGVDPGNPILAGPSGRKLVTLWWAGEAA